MTRVSHGLRRRVHPSLRSETECRWGTPSTVTEFDVYFFGSELFLVTGHPLVRQLFVSPGTNVGSVLKVRE